MSWGEVLYRSPGIFKEYYDNPEATVATKTKGSRARSGDAGLLDQHGHLKIIDRFKDVGRLNDGSLFPPKYIENKPKFFPNGGGGLRGRAGLYHQLLNIDPIAVGSWAERSSVALHAIKSLPQIREFTT